jgi:hypothetical protein
VFLGVKEKIGFVGVGEYNGEVFTLWMDEWDGKMEDNIDRQVFVRI